MSDPSADATATQTWAVLDATQLGEGWTSPPADPQPTARSNGPATGAREPLPAPAPSAPGSRVAGWGAADNGGPGVSSWHTQDTGTTGTGPWAAEDAETTGTGGWAAEDAETTGTGGWATSDTGTTDTGGWATSDTGTGPWGTPDTAAAGTGPWGMPDAETTGTGPWPTPDTETTGRFPAPAGSVSRYQANAADAGGGGTGTRVSRAAARGRKPRRPPSRARVWLLPILMALAVAALVTVAYLHFVKGQPSGAGASTPLRTAVASASPTPSLGPWKHITTRSEDPVPLTLTELFPARFSSSGTTGTQTIGKAGTNCPAAVIGAALQAAVKKAKCTQVLRASYLTTDQKIMGTIGVLNLVDDAGAQRAGQATGATEFIDQLPAAHGPTHSLTKGTGLEEAVYKGHYLILIWAEFANLKAPTTAAQRTTLKTFCDNLVSGTANVSLTSRMVIGKPQAP